VEIHCTARCSRDQNPVNSSGNRHYFVGTGIGRWFAGTMLETLFASHSIRYWTIRSQWRCARARPRAQVTIGRAPSVNTRATNLIKTHLG